MRLTIERLRTMVLLAGILLVVALGIFLAIGRWRSPFNRRDLPKKLGIDIQQEANGFTHAEFRSGRAMFKITASKVEQLKDDRFRLHIVKIEMYGIENAGTDRIEGNEFEYDQKTGIAEAAGPVEITLTRPGKGANDPSGTAPAAQANSDKPKNAIDEMHSHSSEIHVRTSGLSFDQNSGVASTSQRVDFDVTQGSGSAVGASYDSQNGRLVLNREVVLNTMRGAEPVVLHAQHGAFEQGDQLCRLNSAVATYHDGEARAEFATIRFREDGSAEQLDASKGLVLTSAARGTLAAPTGTLLFDEQSNPRHGHLEGGVVIDSNEGGRKFHGTSPTAELEFTSAGMLNHAHLERGVKFSSEEQAVASGVSTQTERSWASPIADLDFSDPGKGQMALSKIHGNGGVEITGESRRGSGAVTPSQMAADDVTGVFGTNSALTTVIGVGHASIVETTPTGTRQSTSGDRLEAHFVPGPPADAKPDSSRNDSNGLARSTRIESATVAGNVVLVQQPVATKDVPAPPPVRATAAQAVYEGAGQWLHLTGSPYVENGGLQLVANKIDFSQASGDAFAHGDVKAIWLGAESRATPKGSLSAKSQQMPVLGAQGPAHIVSEEAHLQQSNSDATFIGHARLWQQGNSIAAPLIVLDRTKQTLVARTTDPAEPVRVVLVTSAAPGANKNDRSESPSVIRVRGGDLKYSDAERKAVMLARPDSSVVAETSTATTRANEVELILLPPGNRAASNGAAAQVDRMTARGQVTIDSMGRKGTGDQLVYSGERGEYTLTGTAVSPPRLTDLIRGTVSGQALIFNSRDDSVKVEGGGRETMTETTVPKKP
jgi:lipopolysaccharide export system protein LptA